MSRFALGNYYPGDSLIHRLDPRLKLGIAFVMMVVIFLLNSPWQLLVYALFLIACQAIAGLPLRLLIRSLRPVLWISLFAFVVNIFTGQGEPLVRLGPLAITRNGLEMGLFMVARLILLIVTSTLFLTLTTTPLLLADALEAVLSPLRVFRIPVHDLAMMMSIALRFVPTLASEADKIMNAQSSRGANYDSGRFRDRMKGMVSILVPLFVSAVQRAQDLALAMEARCYRGGEGRTKLHVLRFGRVDLLFGLIFVLMLGGLVAVGLLV